MLKVITEGMGYEIEYETYLTYEVDKPDIYAAYIGKGKNQVRYTPHTTNARQCMEIMSKLIHLHNLSVHGGFAGTDTTIRKNLSETVASGKTINEAVCLAAYEYFKDGS